MLVRFRNWISHVTPAVVQDAPVPTKDDYQQLEIAMEYRALDEDHDDIRLLRIVRSDDSYQHNVNTDQPVSSLASWQLEHSPLRNWRQSIDEQAPGRFVALSYTWGDQNSLDEITIDGLNLVVRSNLKKALLALQKTSFVQTDHRVWTDAICINQKNVAELDSSIKRMKHIYSQAASVVVWLGDATDSSNEPISFINAISTSWADGPGTLQSYLQETLARQGATIWESLS